MQSQVHCQTSQYFGCCALVKRLYILTSIVGLQPSEIYTFYVGYLLALFSGKIQQKHVVFVSKQRDEQNVMRT